jgi:hypothetical protein
MLENVSVQPVSGGGRDFYAVVAPEGVSTVAEITATVRLEGELVRPATLQFIWTPPRFRGRRHATVLIDELLKVYPDLSHDGHLSPGGEALVRRHGIPLRAGAKPAAYDPAAACQRRSKTDPFPTVEN